MVSGRVHGAHSVVASSQTVGDNGLQETIAVTIIVDTLEESKGGWVRRLSGGQVVTQILNRNMAMTDDVAVASYGLRSGIVGGQRIGEDTSVQVRELHLDIEGLVFSDIISRSREKDDGRNHVVLAGDITHNDAIARAVGVLCSVGRCLSRAEVDEVGGIAKSLVSAYTPVSIILIPT